MPTVLITGASRGLGLEFARQYAEAGWQVIATCRTPAKATKLDTIARAAAGRVEVAALDVGDGAATRRLAASLKRRALDVMIANAGVLGPLDYTPGKHDDDWAEVMEVNVMAPLRLAMALTEAVAASARKQMAFLSSQMGSIANNTDGGLYVYRSSKAALNAVVKSLAIDLKPRGITAVALHPGWVRTDMGGPSADRSVEQGADTAVWLADEAPHSLTGRFFRDRKEIPW